MGVIYKITKPAGTDGKFYVGQTKNYKERMSRHKSKSSGCILVKNAIQKYGDKMIYEIIEENVPDELLNERETFWIKELNCLAPNGLNCDEGGGVDSEVSQFSKDNMSAAHRQRAFEKNGYEGIVEEQPRGFYPRVRGRGKRECLSEGPCSTRDEAIEILNEYARDPEHFVKREGSAKYEVKGSVSFHKKEKKWQAYGKEHKYLGQYETKEEAEKILKEYFKDPENFVRPDNTIIRKRGTGCVYFDKSRKKWHACGKGGKHVGRYKTKEEAESALDKYHSKEIIGPIDFRGELAILA